MKKEAISIEFGGKASHDRKICCCHVSSFRGSGVFVSLFLPYPFVRLFTSDAEKLSPHLGNQNICARHYSARLQYTFVDGLTALGRARKAPSLSLFTKALIFSVPLCFPLSLAPAPPFMPSLSARSSVP